ncbi:hypothetical protein [Paenibacillus sp. NPDC058071]|uniref:hypothetical protein n=1 Tax=Paenibacillus sp. NPDC058071 TaxID=3346326 RepID=UPI0036D936E7
MKKLALPARRYCQLSGLLFLLLLLAGCSGGIQTSATIGNPTAKDILAEHPQTDLFQYNDTVYVNAENIDWVKETDLRGGVETLTIAHSYIEGKPFQDSMATKLPIGTVIYKSGQIFYAEVDGAEVRYLGMIEG